ncbi:tetratricopeptide repeat-containing sensor histidine kinase [Pedobacter sp. L105]|uniref:tetratricopeptide repeat-containing sensor histidine kinase n=1 Tax=Pedobacter sp. L105 TaxID=1641871 RepID=UPI001C20C07E|nr:tetratricopeptide repeat-containing sensor histidine kinase [Pedobacter sp. L105]
MFRTLFSVILVFSFLALYSSPGVQHIQPHFSIPYYEKLIIHYRYDKPDSALFFVGLGLKLAKKNNDQEGLARMLNQLGMMEDNAAKSEFSRMKYLKALGIYQLLNNKKGIIEENIRLGSVEHAVGNYDRAIGYFLYALKLSEKTGDQFGIMESYVYLGRVYATQHNLNKALIYYHKAEAISGSLPFSSVKLNLYADLGLAYDEKGDLAKATSYYEKGIAQSNFPEMMGLNISLTNGLAAVYAKSGATGKAIELEQGALQKSRKIKNVIREFVSLNALAESYKPINPGISLTYFQEALALARSKKANKQLLDILSKIATLQADQGNFEAAYLAKSQQYSIADSVYFKEMSLKIANLQAQYELNQTHGKIQELKFINSRQVLGQKVMLGITAGSVALLLGLGFYFFKMRNLNRLLNKSNADLVESSQVKDKLFSVVGHDLRGPLASVINMIDMINRGWLTEEERTLMMGKLAVQCNASMETLNLLLSWGQMQLKGIMINQVNLLPKTIINRNISLLADAAAQKSITVEKNIAANLRVFCDADHLDFLIRNILSNAIKFTPLEGHILISISQYADQEVLFSVKDNGVGIEPERQSSIFSANVISTVGTNNEKGTSLGLVMCKEFIVANEGKIWMESKAGEGSEFFFTLKGKYE